MEEPTSNSTDNEMLSMAIQHTQLILAWADTFVTLENLVKEYCTKETQEDLKGLFSLLKDKTAGGPYKTSITSQYEESVRKNDSLDVFMDKLYVLNTMARETALQIYSKLKENCYTVPGIVLPVPMTDCLIADPEKYKHKCNDQVIPKDLKEYLMQDQTRFGKVVLYCNEEEEDGMPDIKDGMEIVKRYGPWVVMAKVGALGKTSARWYHFRHHISRLIKYLRVVYRRFGMTKKITVLRIVASALYTIIKSLVKMILTIMRIILSIPRFLNATFDVCKQFFCLMYVVCCLAIATRGPGAVISTLLGNIIGMFYSFLGVPLGDASFYVGALALVMILSTIPPVLIQKGKRKLLGGAEDEKDDKKYSKIELAIKEGFEDGRQLLMKNFGKEYETFMEKQQEMMDEEQMQYSRDMRERVLSAADNIFFGVKTEMLRNDEKREVFNKMMLVGTTDMMMQQVNISFDWAHVVMHFEKLFRTHCDESVQKEAEDMFSLLRTEVELFFDEMQLSGSTEFDDYFAKMKARHEKSREISIKLYDLLSSKCNQKPGLLLPVLRVLGQQKEVMCHGKPLPESFKDELVTEDHRLLYCTEKESDKVIQWLPEKYSVVKLQQPWYLVESRAQTKQPVSTDDDADDDDDFEFDFDDFDFDAEMLSSAVALMDKNESRLVKFLMKLKELIYKIVNSRFGQFLIKAIGFIMSKIASFLRGVGRYLPWTNTLIEYWLSALGVVQMIAWFAGMLGITTISTTIAPILSVLTLGGYLSGWMGMFRYSLIRFLRGYIKEGAEGGAESRSSSSIAKSIATGVHGALEFIRKKLPSMFEKMLTWVQSQPRVSKQEVNGALKKLASQFKGLRERNKKLEAGANKMLSSSLKHNSSTTMQSTLREILSEHFTTIKMQWLVFTLDLDFVFKGRSKEVTLDNETKLAIKKEFRKLNSQLRKFDDTVMKALDDFPEFLNSVRKENKKCALIAVRINKLLPKPLPIPVPLFDFELGQNFTMKCNGKPIPAKMLKYLLEDTERVGKQLYCNEGKDKDDKIIHFHEKGKKTQKRFKDNGVKYLRRHYGEGVFKQPRLDTGRFVYHPIYEDKNILANIDTKENNERVLNHTYRWNHVGYDYINPNERFVDTAHWVGEGEIVLMQEGAWLLTVPGTLYDRAYMEPGYESNLSKIMRFLKMIILSPFTVTYAIIKLFGRLLGSLIKFAYRHKGKIAITVVAVLFIMGYLLESGIASENIKRILQSVPGTKYTKELVSAVRSIVLRFSYDTTSSGSGVYKGWSGKGNKIMNFFTEKTVSHPSLGDEKMTMFEFAFRKHRNILTKMFGEDKKMVTESLKKAIQQASNMISQLSSAFKKPLSGQANVVKKPFIPASYAEGLRRANVVKKPFVPASYAQGLMAKANEIKSVSGLVPTNISPTTKMFTNVT